MTDERVLNKEQLIAVQHGEGPLLIIAGAGSGKTTVITERIKYLILEKEILPSQILALTFTEKAAREMEERVDVAMPYGYTQMWISTFHAFCDRVLRNDAINIGLSPAYKLMTEAESILFLRQNLFKFDLEYFRPLGNPTKFLQGMLQHFNRLKDEDVSYEEYLRYSQKLEVRSQKLEVAKDEIKKTLELANTFKTYEDLKVKEGMMDFSDLISNTLKLFRTRENILKSYQEQFKFILVDEFQDTNYAQNELAILLSGHSTLRDEPSGHSTVSSDRIGSDSKRDKKNITVVGDDDQAIYRWRGAAISNIIQFKKHFPKAKVVTLTKNYRSTEEILKTSYKLIQFNNPDRLEVKEKIDKKLVSVRKIKGEPVEFLFSDRVENEADLVVKKIQELVRSQQLAVRSYSYKDIAILVRANDHAQPFVRAFERARIPYQFLGPGQLFHQEEIKDLISYLRVLYNFEDSQSLYRVLTMPIFDLEAREIASILNFARAKNLTLFEAIEQVDKTFLKEETKDRVKKIADMINRHLKRVPKDTAGQILYYFMEDSGLLKKFISAKTAKDEKISQNIARLFDKLKTYEVEHDNASVFAVVDWIDLSMQLGESPLATDVDWSENNAVNILTVHSSKGLEFGVVFVVNLVTQRFPTRERSEQIPIPSELIKEILPEGDYHLQEERRLFYVAMTRARDHLFLTASKYYGEGKRERKISPFVYEALGENSIQELVVSSQKLEVGQLTLLDWSQPAEQPQPLITHNPSPITYLSYSQIQTFDICPLHYKLRYILKIPVPQTAAQSFGTSIHSTLRDFYLAWMRGEKPPVDKASLFLEKVWINEGYTSKTHERKAFEKAQVIIKSYLTTQFNKKTLPVALELPFKFSLKDRSQKTPYGLKIGGRIDRIDKTQDEKIEIIDYKTGNNMPDEKRLADDLQLTVYALAATEVKDRILGKKPQDVMLSLYFLEKERKLTTTRTLEQLEVSKELLLKKAEEIGKSEFLCSGISLCKTCEYKMLCSV